MAETPQSGRARGLHGTGITSREPIPGFPTLPISPLPATLQGHVDRLCDSAGPGSARSLRLHLEAMVRGAMAHPELAWIEGQTLTPEEFTAGIKLIEGHTP